MARTTTSEKIGRIEFTPPPATRAAFEKLRRAVEKTDRMACTNGRLLVRVVHFADEHFDQFLIPNGLPVRYEPARVRRK